MSQLRQDLAYALRTFVKAPGFALIAILVIVIGGGIGANTAIFSIVDGLLFRSLSGPGGPSRRSSRRTIRCTRRQACRRSAVHN
jgi:hypothetical protein